VLNGYHAKANWRLKGGMKEDSIDILDPKNHKIDIPNAPPNNIRPPLNWQKLMHQAKTVTVKPLNSTMYVVKQNGLKVQNLRNRELYARDAKRDNSKIVKNQLSNRLDKYVRHVNDTPKDVQSVYNPMMHYAATKSLTTKDDPDWKECPKTKANLKINCSMPAIP
jgi:hypothetical protein